MRRFELIWLFFGLFFAFSATASPTSSPAPVASSVLVRCDLPAPANFTLVSLTGTTATFSWHSVPGASQYRLNIYDVGNGMPLPTILTNDTFYVCTLPPYLSSFEAWVEALCEGGEAGTPSPKIKFDNKHVPILSVDEIISFTEPCTMPNSGGVFRAAGSSDYFTFPIPLPGQPSPKIHIYVQDPSITFMTSFVRFLVWAEYDEGMPQIKFQEKQRPYGDIIIRDPETHDAMVPRIRYYSNLVPFIEITAYHGLGSTMICQVKYLINARFKSCPTEGPSLMVNTDFDPEMEQLQQKRDVQENAGPETIENQPPTSFSVYPNPVQKEAFLEYRLPENTPLTISLYNTLGQIVQQIENRESVEAGEYSQYLDLESCPPGVYYVVMQTKEGRFVNTLIRQ